MPRVAVVGAGIIGLSTAVCIQELEPTVDVTLISEKFSPETTGDGAAGVWGPYLLGSTPEEKIEKWSGLTHDLFLKLWNTKIGGEVGISMVPCYRVSNDPNFQQPKWKTVVFGYVPMTAEQINELHIPNLTNGHQFVTFTCEPVKLLPHLLKKFKDNGGNVVPGKVTDLKELRDNFDVVVNCTGLDAHNVVPDPTVRPKRGQVIRVQAPQATHAFLDDSDDGNYIIPNQDSVVLGGTHQENDWNLKAYPQDTKFILEGCFRIMPSLKHSRVLREWVGLRPGRPSVRLELEIQSDPGRVPFYVVHNYGHGGSGVTLFWGCAKEAAEIVQQVLRNPPALKSKL